jgi:hypothetical protein
MMRRVGRSSGALAVAVFALMVTLPATSALAATFLHYGPPNAGAWALSGHSVAGSAGSLPNDHPNTKPWDLPAGDYCSAYKFAQPSAPATSAAIATPSDVNIGGLTGFDPGAPREAYQMRHIAQADSSACQAQGSRWGFWTNAATNNNYCSSWCGVRHDYSTGGSLGTRPWSNGYGGGSKLVMSAYRHVQTFSGQLGISYICAMLQDTTTGQRLEYCLRVWRSWSGAAADAPIVFHNPQIGLLGTTFTTVVSDLVPGGTAYAQMWGGAATVVAAGGGNTYSGAITRAHLVNAVNNANAVIKSRNLGTCLGLLTLDRCYSADPDKYALLGVEDGLELLGSGNSHNGGFSDGLVVYTDY